MFSHIYYFIYIFRLFIDLHHQFEPTAQNCITNQFEATKQNYVNNQFEATAQNCVRKLSFSNVGMYKLNISTVWRFLQS